MLVSKQCHCAQVHPDVRPVSSSLRNGLHRSITEFLFLLQNACTGIFDCEICSSGPFQSSLAR